MQTYLFSPSRRLAFSVFQPCPDSRVIDLLVTAGGVNDRFFDIRQAGEGQVKVNTFLFDVVVVVVIVKLVCRSANVHLVDDLLKISHRRLLLLRLCR